jgi:uncharacterized protein (UPF0264 family)
MTGLLVSVRDADEALAALRGGADVIDIKEPRRGPLGPADPALWQAVRQAVADRRPLSAALGELGSEAIAEASRAAGMQWVKIGLAGCQAKPDWPRRWADAVAALPPHVQPVPVIYADWEAAGAPPPQRIVDWAASWQAWGLVVDTFDKHSGPLTALWTPAQLQSLVAHVRSAGLKLVLAGRLTALTLRRVLPWQPDYVGVRGAVCRGGRQGTVDAHLVKTLRQVLRRLERTEGVRSLTRPGPGRILPA